MAAQVLQAWKVPAPASNSRNPQVCPVIAGDGGLRLEAGADSRQDSARLIRLRRECDVSAGPYLVLAAACAVLVPLLAIMP